MKREKQILVLGVLSFLFYVLLTGNMFIEILMQKKVTEFWVLNALLIIFIIAREGLGDYYKFLGKRLTVIMRVAFVAILSFGFTKIPITRPDMLVGTGNVNRQTAGVALLSACFTLQSFLATAVA